jgi:hypothetical protein
MILSHSRKFIFIKSYKTGGSSLEYVLPRHCGPDDVVTPLEPREEAERRALFGVAARNHLLPLRDHSLRAAIRGALTGRWRKRFSEHSSAHQVRRIVGERIWSDYFTFTIVRNPIDRAISRYYYTNSWYSGRKTDENHAYTIWDPKLFEHFLRYNPELVAENWPMYSENDQVIVDFVVRYERMEEDLAVVSERIGLQHNIYDEFKTVRTKSGIRPPRDAAVTPTASQRAFIARLCEREMALFGYDADGLGC